MVATRSSQQGQGEEWLDSVQRLAHDPAASLEELRQAALRCNLSLPAGATAEALRRRLNHFVEQLRPAPMDYSPAADSFPALPGDHDDQGSPTACLNSPKPSLRGGEVLGVTPLRLSFAQAASPKPGGRLTPLGKISSFLKQKLTPPPAATAQAAPGAPAGAPAGGRDAAPTSQPPAASGPAPAASQPTGSASAAAQAPAQPKPLPSANSHRAYQQRIGALEAELAAVRGQLAEVLSQHAAERAERAANDAAVSDRLAVLEGRLQRVHGVALNASQSAGTLQSTVSRLEGEAERSQRVEADVHCLRSRQLELEERQQREVCRRSVVLKQPEPLPAEEPNSAAAARLADLLGVNVTVVKVRQLVPRSSGSSRGGSGARCAYAVELANAEQRRAVLTSKAAALRGTAVSIDSLLTKQQAATRQQLLPMAKAARQAKQHVQWRHDRLFIDGKEQRQPGSLAQQPQPRSASAPAGTRQGEAGSAEDGEWQPVLSRRQQRRQQQAAQPGPTGAPASPPGGAGSAGRGVPLGTRDTQAAGQPTGTRGTAAPSPQGSGPQRGGSSPTAGGGAAQSGRSPAKGPGRKRGKRKAAAASSGSPASGSAPKRSSTAGASSPGQKGSAGSAVSPRGDGGGEGSSPRRAPPPNPNSCA